MHQLAVVAVVVFAAVIYDVLLICSKCDLLLAERAKPAGDRSWVGGQIHQTQAETQTQTQVHVGTAGEQPKTDRRIDG